SQHGPIPSLSRPRVSARAPHNSDTKRSHCCSGKVRGKHMKPPTHPATPEEIMAFLDGELSGVEAQAVSSHIASCADCSRLAEEFRGTSGAISRWSIPSVPAKLEYAVADEVKQTFPCLGERKVGGGRSLRPWFIALGSLAALALLFFVTTP